VRNKFRKKVRPVITNTSVITGVAGVQFSLDGFVSLVWASLGLEDHS